jgi:hypothetical protein
MTKPEFPKDFDLTYQWHLFCERCGIPENKMPLDQRRVMKRAFFGACGQLLIIQKDELAVYADKHGDEAAANILQCMLDQVSDFWQKEMDEHSKTN